jgi:hypothetical protein
MAPSCTYVRSANIALPCRPCNLSHLSRTLMSGDSGAAPGRNRDPTGVLQSRANFSYNSNRRDFRPSRDLGVDGCGPWCPPLCSAGADDFERCGHAVIEQLDIVETPASPVLRVATLATLMSSQPATFVAVERLYS